MIEYVKTCPKCSHQNPEWMETCETAGCGEFLGFVVPMPKPEEKGSPPAHNTSGVPLETVTHESSEELSQKVGITARLTPDILYLEHTQTKRTFEIHCGHTAGMAHPTSRADVQIANIPGVNHISREHCRFFCEAGRWSMTVIPTTTNETYLNQRLIERNGTAPIRNGDILTMGDVPFMVRIIES